MIESWDNYYCIVKIVGSQPSYIIGGKLIVSIYKQTTIVLNIYREIIIFKHLIIIIITPHNLSTCHIVNLTFSGVTLKWAVFQREMWHKILHTKFSRIMSGFMLWYVWLFQFVFWIIAIILFVLFFVFKSNNMCPSLREKDLKLASLITKEGEPRWTTSIHLKLLKYTLRHVFPLPYLNRIQKLCYIFNNTLPIYVAECSWIW